MHISSKALIRRLSPYALAAALWAGLVLLIVLVLSLAVFMQDGSSLRMFDPWSDWLALALTFVELCLHPLTWLDALRGLGWLETLLIFMFAPYVFIPAVGFGLAYSRRCMD